MEMTAGGIKHRSNALLMLQLAEKNVQDYASAMRLVERHLQEFVPKTNDMVGGLEQMAAAAADTIAQLRSQVAGLQEQLDEAKRKAVRSHRQRMDFNGSRALRNIRRILDLLDPEKGGKPRGRSEIEDLLFMSKTSVQDYIWHLHKPELRRVHIAEWRRGQGSPQPIFGFGPGPDGKDAPKPELSARGMRYRRQREGK